MFACILFGGFLRKYKRLFNKTHFAGFTLGKMYKKAADSMLSSPNNNRHSAKNVRFHFPVQIPPLTLFSFTLSGVIIPLNTYLSSTMVCDFL